MNHLTDDLINKYIDDETTVSESGEIADHLKCCPACSAKVNSMRSIHSSLLAIKEESPSLNFSSQFMERLARNLKRKKQQKYFILTVFSAFTALIFAVLGYLISESTFSLSFSSDTAKYVSEYTNRYSEFVGMMQHYISGRNLTLLGSMLSMGIIISAYFFYNSHKTFKNVLK